LIAPDYALIFQMVEEAVIEEELDVVDEEG
jgi:hypothetical protein